MKIALNILFLFICYISVSATQKTYPEAAIVKRP